MHWKSWTRADVHVVMTCSNLRQHFANWIKFCFHIVIQALLIAQNVNPYHPIWCQMQRHVILLPVLRNFKGKYTKVLNFFFLISRVVYMGFCNDVSKFESQISSDKQDKECEILGYVNKNRVLISLFWYQFQSNSVVYITYKNIKPVWILFLGPFY